MRTNIKQNNDHSDWCRDRHDDWGSYKGCNYDDHTDEQHTDDHDDYDDESHDDTSHDDDHTDESHDDNHTDWD